ncbi:hypothetical protein BH10ACI3_BH10ACI3_21880 [soil metagenome]
MTKLYVRSILLAIVSLGLACGGAPAGMFPSTIGAFHLKDTPKGYNKDGAKWFTTKYLDPDAKMVFCNATDVASSEAGDAEVRHNGDYAADAERTPLIGKTGKGVGWRILAPLNRLINTDDTFEAAALRWNEETRVYDCKAEGKPGVAMKLLTEFEKSWRAQSPR